MLKINRDKMSCDLKRIARYNNMVVFVEMFGRQQIIKSISASFIEKRSSSATPLMAKLLENGGMEFKSSFFFENAGVCDREVNGFLIKGSFEKVEIQTEATENGQRVQENFVSNIYAFDTQKGVYFKLV